MFSQEQIKLFGWAGAGNINPVGIYTWNTGTLAWDKQVPITGGGGGGAVTVADGADVAEGATTDAAVTTDAAGTVSGKLRGLVKWAFERMPASLGQKVMAASLPVVIASDQSALTVTGTVAISGTVPVSGPLTDAQLRASVVPVSAVQSGVWTTGRTWVLASGTDSVAAVQSGTWAVVGTKTNNALAPGALNFGTLPAIATAAAPVYVEGNQVGLSTDLAGNMRISGSISASSSATATANPPLYTEGLTSAAFSQDLDGNLRTRNDTLLAWTRSRQQDTLDAILGELRVLSHYMREGLNVRDDTEQVRQSVNTPDPTLIN